jgi:NitT/TauT family transport system ATP-binding protein
MARALTINPSILLMDEPFGALDQITRDRMNDELMSIWSLTSASVLFVTHSISEAVYLSDSVVVMTDRPGRVSARIEVSLPRPRDARLKRTAAFQALENELRDALGG